MKFLRNIIFLIILIIGVNPFYLSGQIDTNNVEILFDMAFEDLLNQNVVTVSKYNQSLSEAPSSVTVITSKEIRDYGYNTLAEALNSQKGIYISYDRNYNYVGNRGFGRSSDYNNRSKLLINGHSLNANVDGSATLGSDLALNLDIIERIEIVRGPGSSMYGSGAMLNVINIITKKGADINGLNIKGIAGSYNKKEISGSWGKKTDNGIDMIISGIAGNSDGPDLYFEELDSPETNNGFSKGLDWEKLYGLYTEISKNNLTLKASGSNREKGIPTGAWETDLVNTSMSGDRRYFVDLQYRMNFKEDLSLLFRSYYDGYKNWGNYSYNEDVYYEKYIGMWGGAEIQFVYDNHNNNIFSGGVEYKYNSDASFKEWDTEEIYSYSNYKFSEFSLYIQDEYKIIPQLLLTAGLRFDYHSFGSNSLVPRLAAVYNVTEKSALKFLYGEAYKTPNVFEAKYESFDEHKSNKNLDPERIQTTELIWEYYPLNNLYTSISAYHYKIKGLVDLALDPLDGLTYFTNLGSAKGNGLEFELKYSPSAKTSFFINSTLQKSLDLETEEELTNSPRFVLKTGFTQLVADLFTIAPEGHYETKRITVYDTTTDAFFLTNLNISSKMLFNHVIFNFKIRNIFNQEYAYPGGYEHAQHAIIQDGTNFIVAANLNF